MQLNPLWYVLLPLFALPASACADDGDGRTSEGGSGPSSSVGSGETAEVTGVATSSTSGMVASSSSGSTATGPSTSTGTSSSSGETGETTGSTTTGGCTPGAVGCPCVDGACLGTDLQCLDGTCQVPDCPLPGETRCDGECTDLQVSNSNCGECGKECLPFNNNTAGICEAGACQPTVSNNCTLREDEDLFPTCDAVCASIGETCQSCPGTYRIYGTCFGDPNEVGPGEGGSIGCDQMIPWAVVGSRAVRCCCSQS